MTSLTARYHGLRETCKALNRSLATATLPELQDAERHIAESLAEVAISLVTCEEKEFDEVVNDHKLASLLLHRIRVELAQRIRRIGSG